MITKKIFILSGAMAMLFASCSKDDEFQTEEASNDVLNLETNKITVFNGETGTIATYDDFITTASLNNEDEEINEERSANRTLHRFNVDATLTTELTPGNGNLTQSFFINGRFNSKNLATSGRARIRSISRLAKIDYEMRTAALWVSADGRRGAYAGRITKVNQNSIAGGGQNAGPFSVGQVIILYFRDTNNPGVSFTLFGIEGSNEELRERIFPGGDLAYGRRFAPPGGPGFTIPLRGNNSLDDSSRVNLRRTLNN